MAAQRTKLEALQTEVGEEDTWAQPGNLAVLVAAGSCVFGRYATSPVGKLQ